MSQEQAIQQLSEAMPGAANAAAEAIERRASSNSKLDSLIAGGFDDAEKPNELDDFVTARPERRELKERHGADASRVVKAFGTYGKALSENPEVGAELIRGDYLSLSNLSTMRHAEEAHRAASAPSVAKTEPPADEPSWKKLDRLLEANIDEHLGGKLDADRAEMEKARPEFEAMKKVNPSLTWKQFFANAAEADRQLFRNPDAYAARLAAGSGLPVTALQKEFVAQNRQVTELESRFVQLEKSGVLPDLERHAPEMLKIMQRPDFVRSNDPQIDLKRAHRIAEIFEAERAQAVEKAKRAAPVRSSGGPAANSAAPARGGLDGAISAAWDAYNGN